MDHQTETQAAVSFESVSRHFGRIRAVDDVSFQIQNGEFFTFLGPSGSGKTTCLRLIAGFERPDHGTVYLDGARANRLPPYDRDVHTVFQDYALFPHMSVEDNVSYGLMVKGVPRSERRKQAGEALEMVRLEGLGARRPAQLSGGQRQRVALARALLGRPRVLLLDEPLGALDLKLREQMQVELKSLQQQVGITFVYVTHDQEEALAMSDRIAVFRAGKVEQLDTPAAIYDRPTSRFVAGFVGTSNLIEGDLAERVAGNRAPHVIRPERIRIGTPSDPPPPGDVTVDGTIRDTVYLGSGTRFHVTLEDGTHLVVSTPKVDDEGHQHRGIGEAVRLSWRRDRMHRLEREG